MSSSGGTGALGERSQSEVLAVSLVLGMVVLGAMAVVGLGATALSDTQDKLSDDRAEKTLTKLDAEAGLVAQRQAESRTVRLPSDGEGQFRVDQDAGRMKIMVMNLTTNNRWNTPLVNVSLGSVIYDGDGVEMAYQGGGVWRADGDGGRMISPPEFHYRDKTLTLQTVALDTENSIGNSITIEQGDSQSQFPTSDHKKTNPLNDHLVTIEITSEYYRAWGEYFEQRTDGSVDYPGSNTVRLNLTTSAGDRTVDGALVSNDDAVSTEFKSKVDIDSYNSDAGAYPSGSGDSVIYHSGDITFKNGANFTGSLVIEDELQMKQDTRINGSLTHGGDLDLKEDVDTHINGSVDTGASVPDPEPVDYLIGEKVSELESDNDNTADVANLENRDPCTPCNLGPGQYYLDQVDLKGGDVLEIEPEGGTVAIAVDDYFTVKNNATIEVVGDGKVKLYVAGDAELEQDAKVENTGDNAPQFWTYINSNRSFTMKKGSTYTGVVYGPETNGNKGVKFNMKNNAELYGAAIGKIENIASKAEIHYDSALSSTAVFDESDNVVPVTFLHLTINNISMTG